MTIGDFKGNVAKIIASLDKARQDGVDLVLFPELAICGYPPEDLLFHPEFIEEMERSLEEVAVHTNDLTAIVGVARRHPEEGEKHLLNSAAIIENGKVLGFYDKWLLPTYDVFNESRYFAPGESVGVWQLCGKKIGITICEDIWQHGGFIYETRYKRDPIEAMIRETPDLVINLSASPYHSAKPETRVKVCAQVAVSVKAPVILCGQVGSNDQLVFDGYSLCVDKEGNLRHLAKGFEEEEMVVDLDHLPPKIELEYDSMKNLYQALVLGVRDYFKKNGFTKGCLGLSGGIDSALTACIAVEALGKENVMGITMPSHYSSEGSVIDSISLARNLGIKCHSIPIEKPFGEFNALLKPYFEGRKEDVTEENLQARIRGIILMAISNKFGYVVLSTGNKSEMALGYATLYGDMCGGLGVISDVSKTRVYALARWINRDREIIPASTLEKPPSAELRPDQKDSDSLPDYSVVDAVLEGYVEDHLSCQEICEKHDLACNEVEDLVRRIHLAEYKRRQGAPGIRVTKKAFSVGRRFPIVQKWR